MTLNDRNGIQNTQHEDKTRSRMAPLQETITDGGSGTMLQVGHSGHLRDVVAKSNHV